MYLEFLKKNWINTPSATLIRREVFKDIGMFDESRECISCEDYDLWLRMAKDHEMVFCPGVFVSYRVRNSGISQNLDKHLNANIYLFDKLISQHTRDSNLSRQEFYEAFNSNVSETFKRFAFKYYYVSQNRIKAKSLMLEAIRKQPFCLKDILYFIVFSMPEWLFHRLRKLKQKVSAATIPLGTKS